MKQIRQFKFSLAKILRHLLTEEDNETYDTSRTMYVLAVSVAFVLEGYSIFVLKQVFDLQAFGFGMGALSVAFGFAKRAESTMDVIGSSQNNGSVPPKGGV